MDSDSVFILVIFFTFVLFVGTPDLHDALIERVSGADNHEASTAIKHDAIEEK